MQTPVKDIETVSWFLSKHSIDATNLTCYEDLKHNVDLLRLIQFGITVADASDKIGGTWEFNLRFDLSKDLFVSQSIQFLQDNGIDFDKLRRAGIDFDMFSQLLSRVVAKHRNLCWVTFHGLYDLSHTLRTMTNRPLSHSVAGFMSLLGIVLGDVVDIKYMACFCQGLRGGELGLAALAKILNVERVGGAHQAGSDSLLTVRVYTKMRMVYKIHETLYVGCLYGIPARICKTIVVPNTNGCCFIPYLALQHRSSVAFLPVVVVSCKLLHLLVMSCRISFLYEFVVCNWTDAFQIYI
ncbi:PREDICTED: putative CCR4-associated factor 1 homolog 8 [Populus euphratica]|uniref:poly(A)-specific ribonuclease n=1 Tax=Populus euphratica TaxID=75702 RepID=A0AAJ6XPM2_POPEU|nr:PREDICTED: putative CCR4-associated factor 1 homolog 8 [Populus euphratica]